MPCYTRTTVRTEIDAEGKDMQRLEEAAKALGYSVRVLAGGKVEVSTTSRYSWQKPDVAAVQRKYAELTVRAGLKRFGWRRVEEEQSQPQQIHLRARR